MDDLIKFVEDYKKSNPTGWRKWIFGTIAAIVLLFIAVVFFAREILRQKSIADLKHERDVLQEDARRRAADASLEKLEEKKAEHTRAAEAAQRRAAELARQVEILEAEHKKNLDLIDSLRSWDDVDAHIR
jgi:flagellar biosynthesis/type III secretory pathway M-ring protein FliF/YscJ